MPFSAYGRDPRSACWCAHDHLTAEYERVPGVRPPARQLSRTEHRWHDLVQRSRLSRAGIAHQLGAFMKTSQDEWLCCGCGAPYPNRVGKCDCITQALYWRSNPSRHAIKGESESAADLEHREAATRLMGKMEYAADPVKARAAHRRNIERIAAALNDAHARGVSEATRSATALMQDRIEYLTEQRDEARREVDEHRNCRSMETVTWSK